jgi:site-specific DNA-methyltransferase (cytosine-N4-specific)
MILEGDCIQNAEKLTPCSIQTVVTSPPYWGLRNYDNEGQLGQESTPEAFVDKLVHLFNIIRKALKDDGTVWVNIGDTYFGAKGGHFDSSNSITHNDTGSQYRQAKKAPPKHRYIKNGDLTGIPWMFAVAMQKDGWYLKQDIIWAKPNPMPEAVNNRCVKSHEYIFMFTKKQQYYFDADALRVKGVRRSDVWNMNTASLKEAHFAVFPEELPGLCIKAGSKEEDVVLDPFMGSGTTALVAQKLGRKWIGIELNPEYIEIIKRRTSQTELF